MQRFTFVVIIAATIVLSHTATTMARVGAYIGAGVPFTNEDVAGTNGRFKWEPEFGLSGGLTLPISAPVELNTQFGFHAFDNGLTSYDNRDRDVYLVGLGVRYRLNFPLMHMKPFGVAGGGVAITRTTGWSEMYDSDNPNSYEFVQLTSQDEEFYYLVGGGIEYRLTELFSVFLSAAYVSLTKRDRWYIPTEIGIKIDLR